MRSSSTEPLEKEFETHTRAGQQTRRKHQGYRWKIVLKCMLPAYSEEVASAKNWSYRKVLASYSLAPYTVADYTVQAVRLTCSACPY